MQNKAFRFGPIALTDAVADLLNPPVASGGVNAGSSAQYILLKHVRIVNTTGASHNFSFYLGASGGSAPGTEVIGTNYNVPANNAIDWNAGSPGMRIDADDFLTGEADADAVLTVQGEGEIGVSG